MWIPGKNRKSDQCCPILRNKGGGLFADFAFSGLADGRYSYFYGRMTKPTPMKLCLSLLVAILCTSCRPTGSDSGSLQAGSAVRTINPAPGSFIAGDRRNRQFAGIHDSLYVKALAVSDGEAAFVLLTVDCIGLLHPALREIRRAVAVRMPDAGLDTACIAMASTHTHSGPDVVGLWGPDPATSGVDPEYMELLVTRAAETVKDAWYGRRPVRLRLAGTVHGEDWVYNISLPEELDRRLSTAQFTDLQGNAVATVVNFACHPTILDGAIDHVSADYVAGFYREMDAVTGGISLFLQGAIGGWVQPEYEEKTTARALERGRGLARAAIDALDQAGFEDTISVRYARRVFRLPVSNPLFRQISAAGIIERSVSDSVETECAWFGIGRASFATHPGETSPAYSLATRQLMPGDGPGFVIGLGMDGLGYILTPGFFDASAGIPHSEYLTGMSIGPEAGPALMEALSLLSSGN
jgi:hypothetical protein